jgi:uncharacterized membrane protein
LLNVTLFTRSHCELCDQARSDLESLKEKIPHRLVEVDVDSDPALAGKYGDLVPVVEVGPYSLKAPFTRQNLQMTLGAAADRREQLQTLGGDSYGHRVRRGQVLSGSDRASYWLSKNYLLLLNLFVLLYVGLPFLAPALMKAGVEVPAAVLYKIYSPLCHQFGFRSFFLFGDQPYYPLAEAGVAGAATFEEVTGLDDLENPAGSARVAAREFIGNDQLGYKVALCERDIAIYAAMLVFGLVYGLTGRRLRPLHWMAWIVLGMGPIGLDGFSQLFSQFNLAWLVSVLPYRESTPFLRVFTGGLFGWMTAWYAYPYIEESMRETRQFFLKKAAIVQASD